MWFVVQKRTGKTVRCFFNHPSSPAKARAYARRLNRLKPRGRFKAVKR